MQKMILTVLGSALLAGSLVQAAAASEHHHVRKVYRAPVTTNESFRDSNAYLRRAPTSVWPAPSAEPDWSSQNYYRDEALSPPAGR